MSTPSITAPARVPTASGHRHGAGAGERVRRLVRGNEADPAWSRPLLWVVALLAGALTLWGLTRNGYANTYYAEAPQAASRRWTACVRKSVDWRGSRGPA